MRIGTTLTLKYTALTATLFLLAMFVAYGMAERVRRQGFYRDLRSEGITKAHLFLNNQADAATMQSIYRNNRRFINEVEVAVYTPDFRMLYHDAVDSDIVKEDQALIRRILDEKEIEMRIGDRQAVGLLYRFGGNDYVVTAAAYDGYGLDNLRGLRRVLAMLSAVCLSLLFVAGWILARASLRPIRCFSKLAEAISASNISERLPVRHKDELGELAEAFNALLDRLERSLQSQRMFVSNASHELRTPLAALSAELDLALQKERTPEQYRRSIGNALEEARRMHKLIDGLLNLAKADYRPEQIKMQDIRLDELLLDARTQILRAHPGYKIELLFEQEADDDSQITVRGNLYLLTIAFSNLIDNNCKYSPDHSSLIQISFWQTKAIVRLSDTGFGISEADMKNLFVPFRRGEGGQLAEGHGIGMALARKIIKLHGGSIDVHSNEGKGTTFVVELPHL